MAELCLSGMNLKAKLIFLFFSFTDKGLLTDDKERNLARIFEFIRLKAKSSKVFHF